MRRQRDYRKAGIGLLLALLLACAAFIFSYAALAKSPSNAPASVSVGSPVSTDTPTPSFTPAATSTSISTSTVTSTRTPRPTQTGTATPTACPIQFTDVPPGSTFYTYIRCLVCRGFVSGYDDGTFRPNNDVTRGQLSKIVANTAGYSAPIPPDRQSYEDVPSSSPFWLYVERLTADYVVGGYPCGSVPEEPCVPPQNRPYLRVNGPATRGQVAKVVCVVLSCQGALDTQTFEDVPSSHLFFRYVEYLGDRGLVNGYPCGSAGEPCVPPNNRPYFRPYNNTTRGQVAKIVVNVFLGPCEIPAAPR